MHFPISLFPFRRADRFPELIRAREGDKQRLWTLSIGSVSTTCLYNEVNDIEKQPDSIGRRRVQVSKGANMKPEILESVAPAVNIPSHAFYYDPLDS